MTGNIGPLLLRLVITLLLNQRLELHQLLFLLGGQMIQVSRQPGRAGGLIGRGSEIILGGDLVQVAFGLGALGGRLVVIVVVGLVFAGEETHFSSPTVLFLCSVCYEVALGGI